MKTELLEARNKLYEALPTGRVDAFELIQTINIHLKWLDNIIDKMDSNNQEQKALHIADVSNWVAIDIPPPKIGTYIIYIMDVDLVMIGEWDGNIFHGNGTLPIADVVTHWTNLPEPPCC